MPYRKAIRPLLLLAGWLLLTTAGSAQSLAGLWGSPFYRVQLSVSGSAVTGSFARLDNAKAPAGAIKGQLQAGGRSLLADWSIAAGPDTATFKTQLTLDPRGGILSGYRWTEEALPTSFALHRAVNGQLVQTIDEDTPVGAPTVKPGGGTTTVTPGGGILAPPTATPSIELITCESVVDGNPSNVGTVFTAPKSVVALVKYANLPANSTVDWLWTLNGTTEAKLTKTLAGTGWHMHGLRSDTALVPGAYQLTVTLNGQVVAQRTVTVRATATTTPTTTTAPNPAGIEVVMCVSAPGGVAQSPGTQFTKPQSLVCLVKYRDLPANTELKWVWVRNGAQMGVYTKAVGGATGWATHGYTNANGMTPGTYQVSIYVAGSVVTTVTATVK